MFFTYFLTGIGLSMDAFTLSLSLGTKFRRKDRKKLTIFFVGIFHFLMPLLGSIIGEAILKYITVGTSKMTSLIFLGLALQMLFSKEHEENQELNLKTILLIALTVSIDSLSVGIAFSLTRENILLASFLFMMISAFFTDIGFQLGNRLYQKWKRKATYLGILILLGISIRYLFFA